MRYFPYETVRPSQEEMMEKILGCLENKKNLLIHAPTGLGKTSAALTAALNYNLSKDLVIFFLTPKHTQHKIAIETLQLIKEKHSLNFQVIDLIGKQWMCAQPGVADMTSSDFSEYCKNMIDKETCAYYTHLKSKNKLSLATKLTLKELQGQILHVEALKQHAQEKQLCPFEIATLLGQQAKVIIADYYHILSPNVREHLFKRIHKELDQCILILDEAHNLADKTRELLSVEINTIIIEYAAKEAQFLGYKDIGEDILELKNILEKLAQTTSITEYEKKITKEEVLTKIDFIGYEELLGNVNFIAEQTRELKKKSSAGVVAHFLLNWTGPDEAFTRILKKGFTKKGKPFISIHYACLDPALLLKPLAEESKNIIAMSGTLSPLDLYQTLFGFKTETVSYASPFPKKNKLNLIVPDTTTKYTLREKAMFQRIADHCATIVNTIPGNTAIFFPSYQLRDHVYEYFQHKCKKTSFLEVPHLTKQEKTEMIESFKHYKNTGAVLLGASAGSFGEGLDLKENILKCVIVVGLPLSKPDLQTQELIKYYDHKFGKGWDYGYILPALIKCFQNAGRAIRSATDKGVIIYLDERFLWDTYFKAFPKDEYLRITKEPLENIKEFFEIK